MKQVAYMWERFTKEAKAWVHYAQCEAGRFGSYAVGPEHFFLALLREGKDDPALASLKRMGADLEELQANVECQVVSAQKGMEIWPPRPQEGGYADDPVIPARIEINQESLSEFALDAYSMHLMALIRAEAARRECKEISTFYLLLALIRQDEIRQDELTAVRLFAGTEITLQRAREEVAKCEGFEAVSPVRQKPGLWQRLFSKGDVSQG